MAVGDFKTQSSIRKAVRKVAGFLVKSVTKISGPTSGCMAVRKNILKFKKIFNVVFCFEQNHNCKNTRFLAAVGRSGTT